MEGIGDAIKCDVENAQCNSVLAAVSHGNTTTWGLVELCSTLNLGKDEAKALIHSLV